MEDGKWKMENKNHSSIFHYPFSNKKAVRLENPTASKPKR